MASPQLDPVLHELLTSGKAAAARGLLIGFVALDAFGILVVLWAVQQTPLDPLKVAYAMPFFLFAGLAFLGWRQAVDPLATQEAQLISTGEGLARAFLREDRVKAQGARVGTLTTLVLVQDNGKELSVNVPKGKGLEVMDALRRQHPELPLSSQ